MLTESSGGLNFYFLTAFSDAYCKLVLLLFYYLAERGRKSYNYHLPNSSSITSLLHFSQDVTGKSTRRQLTAKWALHMLFMHQDEDALFRDQRLLTNYM